VATLWICIGRSTVRISADTSAIVADAFVGFSQPFQANAEIIP
jgi:hypothetical protein